MLVLLYIDVMELHNDVSCVFRYKFKNITVIIFLPFFG